jgi:hypothetical protein
MKSISTPNNICSACAATGIWHYSWSWLYSCTLQMITQSILATRLQCTYPNSPIPSNSTTINNLLHTAMRLVKGHTLLSLKLKRIIRQSGKSAQCAYADRYLEGERLRDLYFLVRDLSAVFAKHHRQLTKVRIVTQQGIVQLRGERSKESRS